MLTPKNGVAYKKRVFRKGFCVTDLLVPYLDAG